MPTELTSEYTVRNWLDASRDLRIFLGYLGAEEDSQTTTRHFYNDPIDNDAPFSRNDFDTALEKVSRRITA